MAATKTAPVKTAPLPSLADMADELGTLEHEYEVLMAPFKLKMPRLEALRKTLRLACPAAPDQSWTVVGKKFNVELGPQASWRSVDVPKLFKLIGAKLFVKLAKVTLGDLEDAVDPKVLEAVVSKAPTGPRTIKTYEKGAVPEAKAA